MNNRIKNKIYKAFAKYHTDCCTGIIRDIVEKRERKVLIIKTYNKYGTDINFIGDAGVNITFYNNILYVRDIEDIAFNKEIF